VPIGAAAPVVLAVKGITVSFGSEGESARGRAGDVVRTADSAVRGVSFEVRRGEVLALVGESGSGKSVTAMSLLGLLPRTARVTGSARLDGAELIGASTDVLRAVRGGRVGTIFQEPMSAFNPVLTIGAQLEEAIREHSRGIGRAESTGRVTALLESAGIGDHDRVRRAFPHELSGGQLQRSMIAMAIANDPDLLIADEPTTALDVSVQAGILDLIRDLRERQGLAVLLITHDMGVVADLADRVVVLRAGAVVESAEVATLFANPTAQYTRELLAAVPRLGVVSTLDRINDIDDINGIDVTDPAGAVPAAAIVPHPEAVACLSQVDIVYDSRGWRQGMKAVDDVSLSIARAKILGLVGESGSGKSTVGRALAGLVTPQTGVVTVAGIDLSTASARRLRGVRAKIGYVFQDPASSLNPRSTIGDSIGEPLRLHSTLGPVARSARVSQLLDAVQLPSAFAHRYQHELSGGQRQRVAIARAIALEPTLLIADEPTSALDVSVQATVLDLLRKLQADIGFACLFISHDLAVVSELADDVAVMHRGRIVEAGNAAEVLRFPRHEYTRRLLAAAPVADPGLQRERRHAWRELTA